MKTDIHDHLRASLDAWAASVTPTTGDPFDAMARQPGHADAGAVRGRHATWLMGAAATIALAGGALVLWDGPQPAPVPPAQGGQAPQSSVALTDPARIVFTPSDPAWQLRGFRYARDSQGDASTAYAYAHPDGRQFELHIYPIGTRTPGSALRPDEQLDVRGHPAFATDEGPPRYRFDWDEGDRTWEVDGSPFSGLGEFAELMEGFAVVDEKTWLQSLPAPVASLYRQHPGAPMRGSAEGAELLEDPPRFPRCSDVPAGQACSGR